MMIAGIVAAPGNGNEPTTAGWILNEQEYFTRPGADVLVFHDIYPEGKQGGIELIQHGERVAAVGDVRLAATPGQWGLLPKLMRRTVDRAVPSATASLRFEKDQLAYSVRVEPCGDAICIAVDLESPCRPPWPAAPASTWNFSRRLLRQELPPGRQRRRLPAAGERAAGGQRFRAAPAAPGHGHDTDAASEDPLRRLTIEALGGELQLFDGRDNETNGWFVVTSPIPGGATRDAVRWRITPNVVPGWQREPVIAFSQVGYHPDQEKRAVIEFPAASADLGQATLLRIRAGA